MSEKIYCIKCRYLLISEATMPPLYICNCDKNKEYTTEESWLQIIPMVINKMSPHYKNRNNDCDWFEEEVKSFDSKF
jgi:hypothetical protein